MKRFFSEKEKQIMFIMANGKCEQCGATLDKNWEADHKRPFSKGGRTTFKNGQALCQKCNRQKGAFALPEPRGWQVEFLDTYRGQRDFLLVATPGAGKTMAGGFVASRQFAAGEIDYVIIVTPDVYLKEQWAIKMEKNFRISLDPYWSVTSINRDFRGACITYSKVSTNAQFIDFVCDRNRVLVIFDEIHHAGDQLTWGNGIRTGFRNARYRLGLSGTPFRSDNNKIPFVRYQNGESVSDFDYGYGDALRDKVCRNISFPALDARVSWSDPFTGDVYDSITFDDELRSEDISRRLSIALKEDGDYLRETLRQADDHLDFIRQDGDPKAGGLIVTKDTAHAEGVARAMKEITGVTPIVVHSDIEKKKGAAKKLIERYAKSNDKWIVAVQMVSEGVDIPRLRVGVYATTITTELTFRQIIGRVIRRQGDGDDWAFFYVPKDPRLVSLMEVIKEERTHVLHEIEDQKEREDKGAGQQQSLAIWVGFAERNKPGDVMISDGEIYEESYVEKARRFAIECDFKINDAQAAKYLKLLTEDIQADAPVEAPPTGRENGVPKFRKKKMLQDQGTRLASHVAGQWVEKCNLPYREIIIRLNAACKRRFRKAPKQMTMDELQKRIEWLNSIKNKPEAVL